MNTSCPCHKPKEECCENCFKWGDKYGEYAWPCLNVNFPSCHKPQPPKEEEVCVCGVKVKYHADKEMTACKPVPSQSAMEEPQEKWEEKVEEKKKRDATRYELIKDKRKAQFKEHYQRNRARYYANAKKMNEEHPEKKKARVTLINAVVQGKIKRLPCAICGEKKVQGHHYDYNKPLEVIWLCIKHHKALHAGIRSEIENARREGREGKKEYKANFLWPPSNGLDSLLYEFVNCGTEDYRQMQYEHIKKHFSEALASYKKDLVEKTQELMNRYEDDSVAIQALEEVLSLINEPPKGI